MRKLLRMEERAELLVRFQNSLEELLAQDSISEQQKLTIISKFIEILNGSEKDYIKEISELL